jgi:hypothetical protein
VGSWNQRRQYLQTGGWCKILMKISGLKNAFEIWLHLRFGWRSGAFPNSVKINDREHYLLIWRLIEFGKRLEREKALNHGSGRMSQFLPLAIPWGLVNKSFIWRVKKEMTKSRETRSFNSDPSHLWVGPSFSLEVGIDFENRSIEGQTIPLPSDSRFSMWRRRRSLTADFKFWWASLKKLSCSLKCPKIGEKWVDHADIGKFWWVRALDSNSIILIWDFADRLSRHIAQIPDQESEHLNRDREPISEIAVGCWARLVIDRGEVDSGARWMEERSASWVRERNDRSPILTSYHTGLTSLIMLLICTQKSCGMSCKVDH